MIRFCRII